MKSEVETIETREVEEDYPCLKVSKLLNIIVLFSSARTGVVVYKGPNGTHDVGHLHTSWSEYNFARCKDKVTLSND